MTNEFSGGIAVVTGAGSGIGAAVARQALGLGMRVVLTDFDAPAIRALATELDPAGERTAAVVADVRVSSDVERLADETYSRFGAVDVLVNNAGVTRTGFIWDLPASEWDIVVRTNLYGPFHVLRSFLPRMIDGGRGGFVVNVASLAAMRTKALTAAYISTKHAMQALTECLAQELSYIGSTIHVATVLPGLVQTGIFANASAHDIESTTGADHLHAMRMATEHEGISPSEVAAAIFAGLAERRFWISPRPEQLRQAMVERAAMLQRQGAPPPSDPKVLSCQPSPTPTDKQKVRRWRYQALTRPRSSR
jgi:NAD(P)-dependent dehydrogenase (short-subunit alcohol dehydrogenase family)